MTPDDLSALVASVRAAEEKMNEADDLYHQVPGRWRHYEMVYTSMLKQHAPSLLDAVERLQSENAELRSDVSMLLKGLRNIIAEVSHVPAESVELSDIERWIDGPLQQRCDPQPGET